MTNMYESLLYVGLGLALFGLVLGLIYRRRFVLAVSAIIATLAVLVADNCPSVLDPSLQPLQPVLRNDYWLVTHVMTIVLSYSAFLLALGIADVQLGCTLFGYHNKQTEAAMSRFIYRCLQVGVILLVVGTFLGHGVADYSWGRFWGWDQKETFALVTLLIYMAVLHARPLGWLSPRGLAGWTVFCFFFVVGAWYWVNVLGHGLHSYGSSGNSGVGYVAALLALQLFYLLAAVLWPSPPGRSVARRRIGRRRHEPASRIACLRPRCSWHPGGPGKGASWRSSRKFRVRQEMLAHELVAGLPHAMPFVGIAQQIANAIGGPRRRMHEKPGPIIVNLHGDASAGPANHRPPLPKHSVTVSPKPSRSDFCSTTVAERCKMLIVRWASGGSMRTFKCAVVARAVHDLAEHLGPLGIVVGLAAGQDQLHFRVVGL